jgi:Flp pilus assembly protein TadD
MRGVIPAAVVIALAAAACAPLSAVDRGRQLYAAGRYFEAAAAFDEALQLTPGSSAAWSGRGAARMRLGDAGGAIDDLTRAIELDATNADAVFNRGNAHVLAGNFALAVADFTRAAALKPPFSRAIYNRGIARARAGDLDGARADWRLAAALEPDPVIRTAIERRARLAPRTLGLAAPSEAHALADRALTRELAGDRAGALADLRSALELETDPERRAGIENLLKLLDDAR